jgi:predicted PurR-regulated permease PerM
MNKRFKKAVSVVFIMISLMTLFGPVALASETISQALLKQIDQTNDYIYKEIDKAVEKANKVDQKNMSEREKDKALDKIIDDLLEKTEKKVDKLIERAAKEGVVLEKFYIEVKILDRIVLVDPCYAH